MKLFFRILIFVLCISAHPIISSATEALVIEPTVKKPEILPREYVELESGDTESALSSNFTIYSSINLVFKVVREKTYSLLNWSFHIRNRVLEIPDYNRKEQFGRWINDPTDDTCFNTRAKVLQRDSSTTVAYKDTNKCVVAAGKWDDPYTGNTIQLAEGVQIDHLVALKNAYMSGAYKWNFKTRCLYANYMGVKTHLLSVDASENMKKGDKGPDHYMPPNPNHHCSYLKNWLKVKFLWGLRMTFSEAQAISTLIKENRCNLSSFYITEKEILKQAHYYQENIDLCENINRLTN